MSDGIYFGMATLAMTRHGRDARATQNSHAIDDKFSCTGFEQIQSA
jgi:hypothetical protein